MKNRALGRGLSALLKEDVSYSSDNNESIKNIDVDSLEAGEYQPRKKFELDKIKELAESISGSGLLQPIIVTYDLNNGKYKIVAGERRWRACKLLGLNEVPVIVKDLSDKEILKVSLIENIQREELSSIEEAEGYERLIKDFGYSQDELSIMLGKSRSHVSNMLRLNNLPISIKDKVSDRILSMGHARCLINHPNAEEIAEYIIEKDLSVRDTENIVKNWRNAEYHASPESKKLRFPGSGGDELKTIANALAEKFGVKVSLEDYKIGGKLIFHYKDLEELDLLLSRLS